MVAEASAVGKAAGTSMGATAGAIIGSSANMTGEMTVNTARGEEFKVSNLAASNAELAGNALGAGLG